MEITEGMRVQRVDFENDGTPAYEGFIERIERDGDEVTYWVRWEGTAAADPHGRYAFAPLPDVPDGWTVTESTPTSQGSVVQILSGSGFAWQMRFTLPDGTTRTAFCASERDARDAYESAIEAG